MNDAAIAIGADDLVFNNGIQVAVDQPIPPGVAIHLEVIHQVPVLINGNPVLTTAHTVGQAVRDNGYDLYAADILAPPAEERIVPGLIIAFRTGTVLTAAADGTMRQLRSSAASIGAGLADAGIPVEGLDLAPPSEVLSVEAGEDAHLTRVTESMLLEQESIPYESLTSDSAELEFGMEQVVQPGIPGLAVTTTRVQRQDGQEASRETGQRSVVSEPQDRVVLRGTKLIEKSESINGVSISYWRNMQMYATVYSPCNSGTADGSCSSGTASGLPAGKGVVAVDPSLYATLNGQRLYIPGYGFAVIGDIGGGYIIEQNLGISRYKWIDLGFDDDGIQDMTGWISVYFLSPAPPSIPDVLR